MEKSNRQLLLNSGCELIEWAGNLPDLNMIEPCWPWMKREVQCFDKKQLPEHFRRFGVRGSDRTASDGGLRGFHVISRR